MRLNADPKHVDNRPECYGAVVYLDGVRLDHVLSVDDVRGEVEVAEHDDLGNVKVSGGDIIRRSYRGNVFILLDGSPHCANRIGFDEWMARRVEAEHKAYMTRVSRLPRDRKSAFSSMFYDMFVRPYVLDIAADIKLSMAK